MSADNYLAVRRDESPYSPKPWVVYEGNASSGHEYRRSGHKSRDDALDAAQTILSNEIVEYGISVIEQEAGDAS